MGLIHMRLKTSILAIAILAACSGGDTAPETDTKPVSEAPVAPAQTQSNETVDALQLYMLDCGLIEISDLDGFSSAGDYAGISDTFADTCWLLRHPKGNFLWDLGLPTGLVGSGQQTSGVFTLSMERTLTDQLVEVGLFTSDIDMISISHSHFDHSGQADQFQSSKWIVHADEYAAMFPPASEGEGETSGEAAESDEGSPNPYVDFASLEREEFTGEYDVFGDGSAIIIPTPGHTAGHTSLLVNLPETGPVFLAGDLYHRIESRKLKRVPRFNADEAMTLASMELFEARAAADGARIIIQHELDDVADLPKAPLPIR